MATNKQTAHAQTRGRTAQAKKKFLLKYGIGKVVKLKNDPLARPKQNYDCSKAGTIEGASFESQSINVRLQGNRKAINVPAKNIVFLETNKKRLRKKKKQKMYETPDEDEEDNCLESSTNTSQMDDAGSSEASEVAESGRSTSFGLQSASHLCCAQTAACAWLQI